MNGNEGAYFAVSFQQKRLRLMPADATQAQVMIRARWGGLRAWMPRMRMAFRPHS